MTKVNTKDAESGIHLTEQNCIDQITKDDKMQHLKARGQCRCRSDTSAGWMNRTANVFDSIWSKCETKWPCRDIKKSMSVAYAGEPWNPHGPGEEREEGENKVMPCWGGGRLSLYHLWPRLKTVALWGEIHTHAAQRLFSMRVGWYSPIHNLLSASRKLLRNINYSQESGGSRRERERVKDGQIYRCVHMRREGVEGVGGSCTLHRNLK